MGLKVGILTLGGATGVSNAFDIIQTDAGTFPTANGPSTLSLTSSDGSVLITGNALTSSVNFQVAGGVFTVFGTYAAPVDVDATGFSVANANFSNTAVSQTIFAQGDSGAVTITANPPLQNHTVVGARATIITVDDTNTITINDTGIIQPGPILMAEGNCTSYVWTGSGGWQCVSII